MSARLCSLLLAITIGIAGCSRADEPKPDPSTSKSTSAPLVLAPPGLRFVKVGAGDDASTLIKAERDRAKAEGRDTVVYIGAKWCEPCQRFHHAAQKGELDNEFPNLTVIEFDLDEDRDRVVKAGYSSTYIPLFVVPGPDGRASDKRFEGGVKGERAVANLTPKLHALFD
ncbi:MAG: thioredoxin family protein [Labilithrix sp.]